MELNFNVTGERRKALVHAIGEIVHIAPIYKASNKRIFAIGDMTVDKDGVLVYDENMVDEATVNALVAALTERGFPCKDESVLSIEMPLTGFTEASLANLEQLVASKAELIKKSIGTESLPIERTETTLRFPWFSADTSLDEVKAYTVFIEKLCAAAKKQKRVTAVERSVDNEKYAFRCFLLKLGFVGDEYKAARKLLLARLKGNSAWKCETSSRFYSI